MIKLVIYRNKVSNEITQHHECTDKCTNEALKSYNENKEHTVTCEIIELESDSLAYYFYTMKTNKLQHYYDDLRNLENSISDISSRIDDKLEDINRYLMEEKQ